ncbi:hypothetical protein METH_14545 [Leisingera methylohalidivorans DSM 14336]|uniref:Uncharacterized protein n=1 Tax=Leisingera methylohalidivorans DSM 14336 TaxID=999552 RepID=V9W0I4_9RHOB|nr:hypothetical protein METH_14545 [Leisingera methylohalidivorans DSM 14336]
MDGLTASVKSSVVGARSVEAAMEEARSEAETSGTVVQNAVSEMTGSEHPLTTSPVTPICWL